MRRTILRLMMGASWGIVLGLVACTRQNPADVQMKVAQQCLSKGDTEGAIQAYSKAIKSDSKSAAAFFGRGTVHSKKRNWDSALADYTSAIQLDSNYALAYNNRATARFHRGDSQGALADCSKAIELNPQLASAYNSRGFIEAANYQFAEAIADYTEAIRLDSRLDGAYANRGFARVYAGDSTGAVVDCTTAIELNPRSSDAYCARGMARSKLGDYAAGIRDCTKAIEIEPKGSMIFALAHSNRAFGRMQQNDWAGAVVDLDETIAVFPRTGSYRFLRGMCYSHLSKWTEATQDLSEAVRLNPKDATAVLWLEEAKKKSQIQSL